MIYNKKGFTLIELIATVTIMLIIVGIAIPASLKFINRGKDREFEMIEGKILDAAEEYYNDTNIINHIQLSDIIDYIDLDDKYFKNNKIIDPKSDSKKQKCLGGNISFKRNGSESLDKMKFTYNYDQTDC